MPNRCTFVQDVEFEPLEGGSVHFTFVSKGSREHFCMDRASIQRAAYGALSLVASAAREAIVLPFGKSPPA
jgi:hypothetical protein